MMTNIEAQGISSLLETLIVDNKKFQRKGERDFDTFKRLLKEFKNNRRLIILLLKEKYMKINDNE